MLVQVLQNRQVLRSAQARGVLSHINRKELKVRANQKHSSAPAKLSPSTPGRSARLSQTGKNTTPHHPVPLLLRHCAVKPNVDGQACPLLFNHTGVFLPSRSHLSSLSPLCHRTDKPCRQTIELLPALNRMESLPRP